MKAPNCPKCELSPNTCPKIRQCGVYFRTSDSKNVRRFQCQVCGKHYSRSTFEPFYRKRERRKSLLVKGLLRSGVSQRRAAEILKINRKTVVRMLLLDAEEARKRMDKRNLERGPIFVIEFDDLETFEHTKCKPLSVTIAVESKSRVVLGFEVSKMPARGPLADFSREKYGFRKDERKVGREKLLRDIKAYAAKEVLFKSDQNPHYPSSLAKIFPGAPHKAYKGRKPTETGQGELKKGRFDPLFSLNHTCAMFRANVNRLFRKTWCTTKKPERLYAHLLLYADFHNEKITKKEMTLSRAQAKGPVYEAYARAGITP